MHMSAFVAQEGASMHMSASVAQEGASIRFSKGGSRSLIAVMYAFYIPLISSTYYNHA